MKGWFAFYLWLRKCIFTCINVSYAKLDVKQMTLSLKINIFTQRFTVLEEFRFFYVFYKFLKIVKEIG